MLAAPSIATVGPTASQSRAGPAIDVMPAKTAACRGEME